MIADVLNDRDRSADVKITPVSMHTHACKNMASLTMITLCRVHWSEKHHIQLKKTHSFI